MYDFDWCTILSLASYGSDHLYSENNMIVELTVISYSPATMTLQYHTIIKKTPCCVLGLGREGQTPCWPPKG